MRVLWFSNVSLHNKNVNSSGTWIHSMYKSLKQSREVDIVANITIGNCKTIISIEDDGLIEYFVPRKKIVNNEHPSNTITEQIISTVKSINPDIIHVWGLELCWSIIVQDNRLSGYKYLIEIQGLKGIWSEIVWFFGGLSSKELKSTKRFWEYITPNQSYYPCLRRVFRKWGEIEKSILIKAANINTQSDWVRSLLKTMAPNARTFNTGIILRTEFTNSATWDEIHKFGDNGYRLLCITAPRVYKGVHDTIKAFSIIHKKYPNSQLRIAGIGINKINFLNSGYIQYLQKLIREYQMQDSVIFLGNLKSDALLDEMYRADVCLNNTYIESYCLALAEPMSVGVPCIASYTSALPELIENGKDGFLFPLGDYYSCADRVIALLGNKPLSLNISRNASSKIRNKSNRDRIVANQIAIYKEILCSTNDANR